MFIFIHQEPLIGKGKVHNTTDEILTMYLKLTLGFKQELKWSGGIVFANQPLKYKTGYAKNWRWEPYMEF